MGTRASISITSIHNYSTPTTGDTPYSLTYGIEAIIPLEIGLPILRITQVVVGNNDEALDFTESKREMTSIYLVNYQNLLAKQKKMPYKSKGIPS